MANIPVETRVTPLMSATKVSQRTNYWINHEKRQGYLENRLDEIESENLKLRTKNIYRDERFDVLEEEKDALGESPVHGSWRTSLILRNNTGGAVAAAAVAAASVVSNPDGGDATAALLAVPRPLCTDP